MSRILLFVVLTPIVLWAQERTVDATWLHRYLPALKQAQSDLSSSTCHYKPIFGAGDADNRILRSVSRVGEITVAPHGACQSVQYDREEEIYFVLEGAGTLQYANEAGPVRANDFTYLAPGTKQSLTNNSSQSLRALVMGFKIPPRIAIGAASQPRIVSMDQLKEETVEGHPTSVLYKLMVGPRSGKRDAIDEAYVVTSFSG